MKAEILIANHHLVMADLALKAAVAREERSDKEKVEGVLPAYSRVIFDEAHHLEDVAGSYFGVDVSRTGVLRLLSRLAGGDRRNSGAGFLPALKLSLEARVGHVDGGLRAGYLAAIDHIDRRLIPFGTLALGYRDHRLRARGQLGALAAGGADGAGRPSRRYGPQGQASRRSGQAVASRRHSRARRAGESAGRNDGSRGRADCPAQDDPRGKSGGRGGAAGSARRSLRTDFGGDELRRCDRRGRERRGARRRPDADRSRALDRDRSRAACATCG